MPQKCRQRMLNEDEYMAQRLGPTGASRHACAMVKLLTE